MTGKAYPTTVEEPSSAPLVSARRDAFILSVVISALLLLIWNGSFFFRQMSFAGALFSPQVKVAFTALTLNLALLLFGWRRYTDLKQEAALRADGERRAALLATTDAHTGLLNRKGFADRVHALCVRATDKNEHLAIISFQINRFKTVNDRHGYEVGDTLLRSIAAALNDTLGSETEIARLSGDEFAIALTLAAHETGRAERIAEDVLRAVTKAFSISDRVIQVGAFAGIAVAPAAEIRVQDLLRRADIAMDHAKSGRAARPVWFDAGMERALMAHSEIEQGLRFALDQDQFVPFFEPQVNIETGEVVGFEVLARWIHPLNGIISPDTFIPVAEEIGLIGRLSEKVIGRALAEAVKWDPSIKISVNISPSQLTDAWLAQRIVRLLTETGFPADRLVVEITESSLFADMDLARSIVASLKNQGVQLALDDFGTGFSSLSHLRSLPFDMIKIDRSFVTNVHSNKESLAIVRAVTTLAGALGVPVCVEGIEDERAHSAVLQLGCQVGQGWYFGKPMSADCAERLLAERLQPAAHAPRKVAS